MDPGPAGSAQDLQRSQGPSAPQSGRESVVEPPDALGGLQLERVLGVGHRAVSGPRDQKIVEPVTSDVEAPTPLGPAEPFLSRGRIELAAERADIDRDGAERLGRVEQHGDAGRAQGVDGGNAAADPRHVGAGDQASRRADLVGELAKRNDSDRHSVTAPGAPERGKHAGMLFVTGQDLITAAKIEPRQHGVDSVGGRAGQRDVVRVAAEHPGVFLASATGQLPQLVEIRATAATAASLQVDPAMGGLHRRARHRSLRPGVQVGEPVEDRELGSEAGGLGCRRHLRALSIVSALCASNSTPGRPLRHPSFSSRRSPGAPAPSCSS